MGAQSKHPRRNVQGMTRNLIPMTAVLLAVSTAAAAELPASTGAPAAVTPHAPLVATTHHAGRFNGQQVAYTATVEEHLVADDKGAPVATAVTIAYVRDGVKEPSTRPVIFAFNGGPGASSSPLHAEGMGPRVRTDAKPGERASGGMVDNPDSPLDAADLMFIDPPGTGFSRALPGADASGLYESMGDERAVAKVIEDWIAANHREASPHYLVGESYGTVRAALIAKYAKDLRLDGVALIALAAPTAGREMPYVVSLPTMATGAWFHGKIDRAGRSVEQVYREAVEFARTEYVSALIQGSSLPDAERRRVAERMSKLIGLPVDFIEAHELRISKNDYMFNLLKDKGLRTGLLDVRVTAPLEPGQLGALDDPALGVVPKRAPGAPAGPPPTPASIGPVPSPVVGAYIKDELKFPTAEKDYYGVNFTVNAAWKGFKGDAMAGLGEAMRAHPNLRLFWATGYYDLTTPSYDAHYTLDQDGIPPERLTAAYFEGPHGVYAGEANRKTFDDAIRKFVSAPAK
jgi:carboxypeptidase C (cathepsin A)